MNKIVIVSVMLAAAYFADAAVSAQEAKTKKNSSSTVTKADVEFMDTAAKAGLAEVKLGDLAIKKGSREDVRKFGSQMVSDHSAANQELKSLAKSKKVKLPAAPDKEQKELALAVSKLSGKSFDERYVDQMVKDHEKVVKLFSDKASAEGGDPDLKEWVKKTLPKLQHHLTMSKDIDSKVKVGAK